MSAELLHIAKSTHHILYGLFASEMGLSRGISPDNQLDALWAQFKRLQQFAVDVAAGDFVMTFELPDGSRVGTVGISGRDEAQLFIEVFKPIGAMQKADPEVEASDVLNSVVYRQVGRIAKANPDFYAAVLAQLRHHCARYRSQPMKDDMLRRMHAFGLADMAAQLRADATQAAA